ncbi:MAG: Endolytic murein transglycosylase [Patescibacteria group bacterium]|nr:Endolytic murein transglycosylase [Patescibacteria group bacterium]
MEPETQLQQQKPWYTRAHDFLVVLKTCPRSIVTVCVVIFVSVFLYVSFSVVPARFPIGSTVTITPGESLQTITSNLQSQGVIRSGFIFRSLVIMFGGEKRVIAGDYLLKKPEGAFSLAYRFARGKFGIDFIKVTIPEGWSSIQIADYLGKNIKGFDANTFATLAKKDEGYLFPDTYFFSPTVTPQVVVDTMKNNFNQQIKNMPEIAQSGKSLRDILTMASILEGEALPKDRPVVAGILWSRLSLGIPLQVDSTFTYINGKNTYTLTKKDLAIDSPYNTYKYKGLPPGPINNPGKDAILAAINPVPTAYLYFLTDKQGNIYYAKTFEEHKRNKAKYL